MAKLTAALLERLAASGDALVDVIVEVRAAAAPKTPAGGSRAELIASGKRRFLDAAAPVERSIARLGGEVLEHAWINGTLRARIPASQLRKLTEAKDVASIDLPHPLTRE